MRFLLALPVLLIGLVHMAPARAGVEEIRRAESALRVLDEMNAAPDQRIPAVHAAGPDGMPNIKAV